MGWYGGTEIFDCVIKNVLDVSDDPEVENKIIGDLYDVLRNQDWDVVQESSYFDNPRVIKIIKQKEPEWFEDEDED